MQLTGPEISVKVFISYAHTDGEWRKKLEEHLSPLSHSGKITLWLDQEIPPGGDWEHQITTHLDQADLILLLVSASFIASKYCWSKEVQVALQRHNAGTAKVIPIILKPTLWQETPLGELQALPTEARPVTQWDDSDAALENVAQGIRDVVTSLLVTLRDSIPASTSSVLVTSPTTPAWRRWLDIGIKYGNVWCYTEALCAFRHALGLDPNNVLVLLFKGMALTQLKRYEDALNTYEQIICLHPGAPAYRLKSMLLTHLDRYEDALGAYMQAIRLDSANASVQWWQDITLESLQK